MSRGKKLTKTQTADRINNHMTSAGHLPVGSNPQDRAVVTTPKPKLVPPQPKFEFFETDPNPGDPGYSSTIAGARYDLKTGLLQIVFKDRTNPGTGRLYNYDGTPVITDVIIGATIVGIPMDLWVGFKAAGSKGSYFHAMIEKRFKGVKQ